MAVEGLMPVGEQLVVGAIARAVGVEQHQHQPGLVLFWLVAELTAHAAGGLDVFGGGLGLIEHHHQAEACDVQAHRDHVGGQGDIQALLIHIGL